MDVDVVVEIPKGSRNKYEYDEEAGRMRLDRMLFTATHYPADYGYVPGTMADDDDPLDALVLLEEPTFPGCLIRARIVAMFKMRDEKGIDAKLLCVPATDSRWNAFRKLGDIPAHLLEEVSHFFEIYKTLEPEAESQIDGWVDRAEAEAMLESTRLPD